MAGFTMEGGYATGAARLELDTMDEKLATASAACQEYMAPWTPAALEAWQRLTERVGRGSTDSLDGVAAYELATVARWNGRMSACQFGTARFPTRGRKR